MGKRAEDLHLNDSPIERHYDDAEASREKDERDRAAGDERDTAWYQFLGDIDDLLASDNYGWAMETLDGIRATVERTKRVTEGQRRAVSNIENRGESRRYEGWRGRGR